MAANIIRVGFFPDDCFGDAFGPEIEVTVDPPGIEPPGARLKPGDINGDGGFNITDPVAHLGFLFTSGPVPPCFVVPDSDPVALTDAGWAIFDYNGDGNNNLADPVGALNFLFAGGGNPHALGEDCVELAGTCTSNCP